jgi:hypothetical protein
MLSAMRTIGVAIVLLSCTAATARADDEPDPGPVQAELDCGIGGKALSPLGKNTIGGHVACRIVLDGFSLEGVTASAWVIQDGVESDHRVGAAQAGKTDSDPDIFSFDPFQRGMDVRPCRDFTVHGELVVEGEVAWSTDLPVATRCKKPKKVSAKLSCLAATRDGNVFAYPGNGAKAKPRLDDTVSCWIAGPKSGGATLTATINGHAEPMWQDDDTHAWSSGEMLEPDADFTTCQAFAVSASIQDADGQTVWTGKLTIAQRCAD